MVTKADGFIMVWEEAMQAARHLTIAFLLWIG